MDCFSRVSKSTVAVEMNEKYCFELVKRSAQLRAAGIGGFNVSCASFFRVCPDAAVYTWWQQAPMTNSAILKHLRSLQEAGIIRRNAEAVFAIEDG